MKFVSSRSCLPIVLLQLWLSVHLTLSSSISGSGLLPPIPRWQESWTASQAHGTAMAMAVGDCLVVVLRSPSTNVYKPSCSVSETTSRDGLTLEKLDREHHPPSSMQYAPSWFPIGSHSICAMTGLALDVEHVCRMIQKKVDDHLFVYQESVTTHAMTQTLASFLQQACLSSGGRPYGVQCMLMGCDDIDPSDGALCIYSMDPTGTWQSWKKATAIGKFGTDVRRLLAKKLQESPITELKAAVNCLLTSWKETCLDLGIDKNDKEDCQVLVLQRDPKNKQKSCLFRVSKEQVDQMMQEVEAATVSAKSS